MIWSSIDYDDIDHTDIVFDEVPGSEEVPALGGGGELVLLAAVKGRRAPVPGATVVA